MDVAMNPVETTPEAVDRLSDMPAPLIPTCMLLRAVHYAAAPPMHGRGDEPWS
jgi:hypothetical protein